MFGVDAFGRLGGAEREAPDADDGEQNGGDEAEEEVSATIHE